MIKVTIIQITPTYYSLGMISGDRQWFSGNYGTERNAKSALTRTVNRGGGKYQAISFDVYQDAIRAINK